MNVSMIASVVFVGSPPFSNISVLECLESQFLVSSVLYPDHFFSCINWPHGIKDHLYVKCLPELCISILNHLPEFHTHLIPLPY